MLLFFFRVNETSTSKTTQKSTDNIITILVSTSVVLSMGAVICIVATVVIKRRKCNCIKGKGISRKRNPKLFYLDIEFCITSCVQYSLKCNMS